MEIIEAGSPDKQWPREWRTPCCQSLVRVAPEDIKHNTDYTGDHTSWFVNCPVCGAQPDVPDAFKREADRWLAQHNNLPMDGLHEKFIVNRLHPSSRGIDHSACRYFVLDPQHDAAAAGALQDYAERALGQGQEALHNDLRDWLVALGSWEA